MLWIGFVLITLVLVVTILVLAFKPQFGWMVGPWFLPAMSIALIVGGLLMIAGAWRLRAFARPWQWTTLAVFGLIALVSPAFGFLFLAPFTLLGILWPLVLFLLVTQRPHASSN